jgi:hypothetical protein
VPSDTQMREILDPVDPEQLRPAYQDVFREWQRGKAWEPFVFYRGCSLLLLDGSGYLSSEAIYCDSCLQKTNKQTEAVTYQHQLLGAALAHPDHREVIPLAPEPIVQQDGTRKNDCERNAAKRLLRKIRKEHPRLKLIVVEDGLASNAPHIRELKKLHMHFILGAKPGDHVMWELTLNRIAASGVAASLLVYAGFQLGAGEHLWRVGCYIGLCLGLIWFGQVLGQHPGAFGSRYIGQTTPGILVIAMGWLLVLLTPLAISAAKARMIMGW